MLSLDWFAGVRVFSVPFFQLVCKGTGPENAGGRLNKAVLIAPYDTGLFTMDCRSPFLSHGC